MSVARLFGILLLVFGGGSAFAQCTWTQQPTAVAFGAYSVFSPANANSNGTFTISCTALRQARVTLSRGGGPSYTPRRFTPTGNYNLFLDAARSQIWGDGTGGTSIYTVANWTFGTQSYAGTIFGEVPAGQDLAPGAYSDLVVATLSYAWSFGGAWTPQPNVTFPVSMNIVAECRVDTFDLPFGNYNPFSAVAAAQTATVKVYCTRTTPATIGLDLGANALGAQRRMRSAGGTYLDYGAVLASGSGTSTSNIVPLGGGITLNGSVPVSQDVPVGIYTDTLQALVNY